ncbi:class I SAM-dependent methyltransferase [Maricaulis virginensis]|uniref:Methyltransferase domain-containing protein n=1 Tax=Maricaulis virginensis TaxID=144022 RepID=A0A9W6MPB4_9PROT|nr:class I SAM-dependent methyltransferase [Maricaulis virginensis]GLK52799.1 hypothetical protein GCM10017621_23070 [Maricaulis virginensis]
MPDRQIHPAFEGDMAASYDARNEPMAALRDALHLLAGRLLLQDLLGTAEILCVGAGTGKEVLYLASLAPDWRFTALDPSADMLAVCRREVEAAGIADRVRLFEGYVDELDDGIAYDAATSILASHFITDRTERLAYFTGIAERLRSGGILINADLSGDRQAATFDALEHVWLSAIRAAGLDDDSVASYRTNLDKSVGLLPPPDLAALIASAGFSEPAQFYQGGLIHAHTARRL